MNIQTQIAIVAVALGTLVVHAGLLYVPAANLAGVTRPKLAETLPLSDFDSAVYPAKSSEELFADAAKTRERGDFGEEAPSLRNLTRYQEVDGGLWFNTGHGIGPCTEEVRGMLWFVSAKDGYADQLVVCAKGADDKINWRQVY